MKKIYALTFIILLFWHPGVSQENNDSLRNLLSFAKDDTSRILRMAELCHSLAYWNYDSAVNYGEQALALSERINYKRGKLRAYIGLGNAYLNHGDIAKGLKLELTGLQLAEENQFMAEKACFLMGIGWAYRQLSDYPKAIVFLKSASRLNRETKPQVGIEFNRFETEVVLGNTFLANNQPDSALMVLLKILPETQSSAIWRAVTLQALGDVYTHLGDFQKASAQLHESLDLDIKNKDEYSVSWACNSLAKLFREMKQPDSCIFYAKKALAISQEVNNQQGIADASKLLSEQYELIDVKKALSFHKIYDSANNVKYGAGKVLALQRTLLEEQELETALETKRIAEQNQLRQYLYLAGLGIVILIAFLLYRNNRQKQKANQVLQRQKGEIQSTLTQLKSTQAQLIQSEKMASLGELTAGIAHEIQNPLNFVNNFSELSNELITEMNEEIGKGNTNEVKSIANDIKQNLEKINHHGKRADSIVKGMLQHSQKGSGQKEPTDLNAMAEEYLRLAYHGCLAKDITLNASFVTDLDKSIGNINLVQQDISRVLLNLYSNAFYAVSERQKKESVDYQPMVTLTTKRKAEFVEISVKDNGSGIPESIKDKIFQPFFTTKPTGQGTGLGLSLSYDIIKAHQGNINIRNITDSGVEFIMTLPINA